MKTLCITNGRVIDPANSRDEAADLWIRDGVIIEAPAKKDVAGEQRQLDSHFAPGVEAGARDQRKEAAKSGSVQFSGKDFFLPALGSKHEPGSKRNVGETRNYPISQRNGSAHDHSPCSEKIRSSRCVCAQT